MKKTLALIFTLLFTIEMFPQQGSSLPFAGGEKLTYTLKYQWGAINTDVGEVVFTLDFENDSERQYCVAKAKGRTFKFYDVFFKVRDYFESRFYPEDFSPIYFHRDVFEGKYKMKNYIHFLSENKIKASYKRMNAQMKDTLLKGSNRTLDLLTLIYYMRSCDYASMTPGNTQQLNFVIDGKLYNVKYRYVGKEVKVVAGLGEFNTYRLAVSSVSGSVFKGTENLQIWLSADENMVPLQIETPIRVGNVTARISDYSNLKYPLISRIK